MNNRIGVTIMNPKSMKCNNYTNAKFEKIKSSFLSPKPIKDRFKNSLLTPPSIYPRSEDISVIVSEF